MGCKDFDCLCCKETIVGADDCYAVCELSDVNAVRGDICESCFGSNTDEDLFNKIGLVSCDGYSEELVSCLKTKALADFSIDGLRKALERYDADGGKGACGNWEIKRNGEDPSCFTISRNRLPLVSSGASQEYLDGGSRYVDLHRENGIPDKIFSQICTVVKSVYVFARPSADEQKRMKENGRGQSR